MSAERAPVRPGSKTSILLLLLLMAAFAGNFFAYQVFIGFSYLFGSIAVLLVVYLHGIRWGLVAGVIASSWTIVLFGHPYAMIWLCGEPLFVGWLLKKGKNRNIIFYDALYWPFIGVPLLWIFFRHVMHVPLSGTMAASLMYWLIGITNALAASLLLTYLPRITAVDEQQPSIPIHKLIFNLLLAIVLLPAMVVMILHGKHTEQEILHLVYEDMNNSARMALYEVRLRLQKQSDLKELSRLPEKLDSDVGGVKTGALREVLLASRIKPFHRLTLIDDGNRVIATTGDTATMEKFENCKNGTMVKAEPGYDIMKYTPAASSQLPLWLKTQETSFLTRIPVLENMSWSVVAETPFAPYQKSLFKEHIQSMLVVLGLNILAMMASMYASHSLSAPLRKLSGLTTDLPTQLLREQVLDWSSSNIAEIDQLTENFRAMAAALGYRFQEITNARKNLELRVEERTRELSALNAELQKEVLEHRLTEQQRDQLLVELRLKNKELEGIIYIASHDLRSPLVNVQGFSRKLAKNCAELERIITLGDLNGLQQEQLMPIIRENIPRSLKYITNSVEKMDSLLNGLLRLSRLGRAALNFEMLDMAIILEKIIASMTYQFEQTSAQVEVGRLDSCFADAGQVTQVFSNLLDNALKYSSPDRPLQIKIYSEELQNTIRYCVEDNGMGIAPEHQEQIWEIFHRLNPKDTPGEGLGLTMSRLIVERLGGTIWVESEPGVGSRFYLLLPKQDKPELMAGE